MKKVLLAILLFGALFAAVTVEQFLFMPPIVRAQTNTFCAANLICTVTAAWTFTSGQNNLAAGIINKQIWVGPVGFTYTTIAAAIASSDCPTFGCSIFVRSDATLDASTVSLNTKQVHITFDSGNFASAATGSLFSCTAGVEGIRISGQSRNGTGNSSGTLLSTSGTATIAFNFTNCPGAELDHFTLSGPGSGTGTANKGIVMAGHDVKMDSVLVTSYGGVAVTFDGTSVNTNDWKFWNSRVQNSGTTGILVTGANANNGVVISSSSGGNLGVGMLVTGTAQFTNIIGLDTAGNAAIGLELNSPNNFVVMFSDAPNAPETAAIQFDAAALNNEIHCLKNAMPINTDNGAGNRYYGCGGTFGAGGSTWNTVNAQFFTAANGLNLTERPALSGSSGTDVMFGDSADHFLKYNPNNQGEQHLPQMLILTSAYTNATTTFSTVAGGQTFSFPVKANTNYTVDCHLYYQAAATGGLNIQFTGPAAPTQLRYAINAPLSVNANNTATASAFATSLGAVVTTATTDFDATVTAGIVNGANAGTVTLQAKSSAAVNLTIQPGSYCSVQ